jgi:acetylornithine deacetylase/succinyl-diaminopimelate desuccinylase-like protein
MRRRTGIACASTIFLMASALGVALQATAIEPVLDWASLNAESISKLREYIRIDTSNPPGNESRGVAWYAKIFDSEGIPYQTGEVAPGRGSIVARLRATVPAGSAEPAFVLLNHIDVVPASREYWTVDPFAAEIKDGYIW